MKIQIGDRFGRLEVIGITDKHYKGGKFIVCKCDCGNIKEIRSGNLISGNTRSCGCLAVETSRKNKCEIPKCDIKKGAITHIKSTAAQNLLGEKHIYKTSGGYRVIFNNQFMKVSKMFGKLDRAIVFRDEIKQEINDRIKGGEING